MKIAIGNDHAAPQLKNAVKKHLEERGFEVVDVGCAEGERCDYPDKAVMVCEKVVSGECGLGILICGTGLGMSYAANKVKGIRAACCSDYFSARLSRITAISFPVTILFSNRAAITAPTNNLFSVIIFLVCS